MRERTKSAWTMPDWMEQYRCLITNTGGNEIEDLIDRFYNQPNLAEVNMPVFTLSVAVGAQVGLLNNLRAAGLLHDSVERPSVAAASEAINALRQAAQWRGREDRDAIDLARAEFEQAYGLGSDGNPKR